MILNDKYIFLVVGKSGTGKDSLCRSLHNSMGWNVVCSYTTRPKRYNNEDTHIFVDKEYFQTLKPDLCAYTFYNGYEYGVTQKQIDENDLFIVDKQGIDYFTTHYKGHRKPCIVFLDAPWYTRVARMKKRGDTLYDALKRIRLDKQEFYGVKEALAEIVVDCRLDLFTLTNVVNLALAEVTRRGVVNGQLSWIPHGVRGAVSLHPRTWSNVNVKTENGKKLGE